MPRTTVIIELDVDYSDGLTADEVAGYAQLGASLALEGVGLPTPWEDDAGERVSARTAAIRLAGF